MKNDHQPIIIETTTNITFNNPLADLVYNILVGISFFIIFCFLIGFIWLVSFSFSDNSKPPTNSKQTNIINYKTPYWQERKEFCKYQSNIDCINFFDTMVHRKANPAKEFPNNINKWCWENKLTDFCLAKYKKIARAYCSEIPRKFKIGNRIQECITEHVKFQTGNGGYLMEKDIPMDWQKPLLH